MKILNTHTQVYTDHTLSSVWEIFEFKSPSLTWLTNVFEFVIVESHKLLSDALRLYGGRFVQIRILLKDFQIRVPLIKVA